MPLDFKRATDLFMGTEDELGRALEIDPETLRRLRARPSAAPPNLLRGIANVLDERGRAMVRVAEMLREQAQEGDGRENGQAR